MATVKELESAAANGDIDSICILAKWYFNHNDYANSRKWSLEGAAVNDDLCLHLLGTIAREEQNYAEAVDWYTRNINVNGHSMSASNLGFIYLNVEEDPKIKMDINKAEEYFKLALEKDDKNGEAAFGLAICHLNLDDAQPKDIKALIEKAYQYAGGEIKVAAEELLKDIKEV